VKFSKLRQLFSLRDLRNGLLAFLVIVGGVGLALLTLYAHRTEQPKLAGIAAAVSLVFVILILIFVVPPLARNASKEANQLNLPFEITIGGAIMIALIVIVAFSAWNTGNNLLFLVLSFLTGAMMVGFMAGAIMLKKLDVKMRFPETIFAGEETPILVTLNNRKKVLPSISVVAEVRGNERERSIAAEDLHDILPKRIAERLSRAPIVRRTLDYFVHVPRSQMTESRTFHVFPNRGRFLIKDFEISTKFPFAFFRHRRRLPAKETELIVFPPIDTLDNEIDSVPLDAGKVMTNLKGSGQDLLALRDYHPNDDLRRVDWKATARSRHLIVREFAAEDDKKITVFLDRRTTDDPLAKLTIRQKIDAEQDGAELKRSEDFERAVRKAASLIAHFTEEQAEICLIIDDEEREPGIGTRHLHDCLKRLAVADARHVDLIGPETARFEALVRRASHDSNSHIFAVTAAPASDFPPEIADALTVVHF